MKRQLLALTTAAGLLLLGAVGTPTASAQDGRHGAEGLLVTGTVSTPMRYTSARLAGLTRTTLPDLRSPRRHAQVTGTLLEPLVIASSPVLPDVKNAALRVTLTVTGAHHEHVSLALGELAPGNGNHPALLVPSGARGQRHRGVDLVLPGDRGDGRTVHQVREVAVAVAAPALPTDVPPGAVRVVSGRRSVTLGADVLATIPGETRTVAYQSGQGPQQHVETGPDLANVLRAARIHSTKTITVAAIATDGYVATVTPAEATSGRRPLLLSLTEDGTALERPRLVTDGDVSGGRDVSGVVVLEVEGGHPR
ncbi:MAG: hypothetical protein ACRYG2_24195 [Janthinobacterium lividum]